MKVDNMSPADLRKAGLDAISKALTPIGMVRFMQQYESGTGNYTKERGVWQDRIKVKDIVLEIKRQRK